MPKCPYCGRWFRTKRGLKIHIGKVHMTRGVFGERVPDILSIDPLGILDREMKRMRRRARRKRRVL